MIVDTFIGIEITKFYATKAAMVEPIFVIFQWQKDEDKPVNRARYDNAGKNIKLDERTKSAGQKLNIAFEYTARDTPQQYSVVKVGIVTISGRGKAMMIATNVPLKYRYKFFREAFTCATDLRGLTVP